MRDTKAVRYEQPLFRRNRPLASSIDRLALLRSSGVNFIPDGRTRTVRTAPMVEDSNINWRERYLEAATIYITNPLCFSAQSLLNDEIADGRTIIEEKQGSKWVEHTENDLAYWMQQPNVSMDWKEFLRAYSTHFHTFGGVYSFMFQKGDILPNGKINITDNCFDLIFPARIAEDTVSNPYGIDWWYLPIGRDDPLKLNPNCLFTDVIYNPIAHGTGVALPTNPLKMIFDIHRLYMKQIKRFFTDGAMPSHLLTRVIDLQKDSNATSITDDEIEETIQRIYSRVGRGGERESGWLGLRGDWRVNKLGSELPALINKEVLQYIDALISGVYKIPPSLFWAGMQSSNQRASRQQDSIDFYNMKIHPMQERITSRLGRFFVPKFLGEKNKDRFRMNTDVSEMALAQYAITKQYRMYERWYQLRIINRGKMLEYVNEPTTDLTEAQRKEWYSGSNNSQGMNAGAGEQSIEEGNGLE